MADAVDRMKPVTIASLHGHCIGGGVVLASACDLRIASEETIFSIPEVDLEFLLHGVEYPDWFVK